jgi:UDP-glucuronate decarboxylase
MRNFHPRPVDGPKQRRPDIELAQSKLGWKPKISLDDGSRETVRYYRNSLL